MATSAAFLLAACVQAPAPIDLPPVDGTAAFGAAAIEGGAPFVATIAYPTRTVLANDTSLPGENFILRLPSGGLAGNGTVDQILRSAGPLPPPFEFAIARDFMPLNGDTIGYVARTPASGVTCVLAAGQTGSAYGAGSAMLMRNCVRGGVEEALAPVASLPAL